MLMNFSKLLLYIPGILIFLVGSSQTRTWLKTRKPGSSDPGTVVRCTHIVKKDKKGRVQYDYYDILAEYADAAGHLRREVFKSPSEYAEGQQVRIYHASGAEKSYITEKEDEYVLHPLVMMIGGALLILLALEENSGHEVPAMACLAAILAGSGVSLLFHYIKLKKRNLKPLEAEVIRTYSRQISKETKILRGNKYTAYPIVRYTLDGRECIRRCNINSSQQNAFKEGEHMVLYVDENTGNVYEKNASILHAVFGILLLAAGILAGLSILSVVL